MFSHFVWMYIQLAINTHIVCMYIQLAINTHSVCMYIQLAINTQIVCKCSHVDQSYSNFEFSVVAILKILNGGYHKNQVICPDIVCDVLHSWPSIHNIISGGHFENSYWWLSQKPGYMSWHCVWFVKKTFSTVFLYVIWWLTIIDLFKSIYLMLNLLHSTCINVFDDTALNYILSTHQTGSMCWTISYHF